MVAADTTRARSTSGHPLNPSAVGQPSDAARRAPTLPRGPRLGRHLALSLDAKQGTQLSPCGCPACRTERTKGCCFEPLNLWQLLRQWVMNTPTFEDWRRVLLSCTALSVSCCHGDAANRPSPVLRLKQQPRSPLTPLQLSRARCCSAWLGGSSRLRVHSRLLHVSHLLGPATPGVCFSRQRQALHDCWQPWTHGWPRPTGTGAPWTPAPPFQSTRTLEARSAPALAFGQHKPTDEFDLQRRPRLCPAQSPTSSRHRRLHP